MYFEKITDFVFFFIFLNEIWEQIDALLSALKFGHVFKKGFMTVHQYFVLFMIEKINAL